MIEMQIALELYSLNDPDLQAFHCATHLNLPYMHACAVLLPTIQVIPPTWMWKRLHIMASKKPTPATTLVPITDGPSVHPAILDLTNPTPVGSPTPYTASLEHQEFLFCPPWLIRWSQCSPPPTL